MKYLMVTQYGSMDEVLFGDIIKLPEVNLFYVSEPMANTFLYKLRRIHTSMPATKYFEPPMKNIWYQKKLFSLIDNDTCVIFQPASMIHIGMSTLKNIHLVYPGCKLVLLLLDSIHAHSVTMRYAKKYIFSFEWDLIFSFDESDCREYGFTYMGLSYYSKIDLSAQSRNVSDLFYIGAKKDEDTREKLLLEIYNRCKDKGIICNFKFRSMKKHPELEKQGINMLAKPQPYRDVLNDINATNCILEIMQPGQNNQTARYMEAVCYNKKLLTNNTEIVTLPFYNPQYMKVFISPDDIDFEWIKKEEAVNYNYDNEFSPIRILRTMEETWK